MDGEAFEAMMAALSRVKTEDVLHDCRPLLVIYKDGQVERFAGTARLPPSADTLTGVDSRDVTIDLETGLSVRLYKPQDVQGETRKGVIVYYHGGGFCVDTVASPMYHNFLNKLCCKTNMIIVSVDYRRPPEHPLPIGYDDSWAALKWVCMGHDPWVREHGDLDRVFLVGDSAGANIAHHMAKRLGTYNDESINSNVCVKGLALVHPYFWGVDRIGSEEKKVKPHGFDSLVNKLWPVAYPTSDGLDDPLVNPGMDVELGKLGVDRVKVWVAEQDVLRDRGFYYKEVLLKSGWKGDVHVVETLGENHVFHLMKPDSANADEIMNQIVDFLIS